MNIMHLGATLENSQVTTEYKIRQLRAVRSPTLTANCSANVVVKQYIYHVHTCQLAAN